MVDSVCGVQCLVRRSSMITYLLGYPIACKMQGPSSRCMKGSEKDVIFASLSSECR